MKAFKFLWEYNLYDRNQCNPEPMKLKQLLYINLIITFLVITNVYALNSVSFFDASSNISLDALGINDPDGQLHDTDVDHFRYIFHKLWPADTLQQPKLRSNISHFRIVAFPKLAQGPPLSFS
ncbi:MAG: hypothetical protein ACI9T9_001794 [Oleiphilaceae bacterium]|jgi:hypothetical protein